MTQSQSQRRAAHALKAVKKIEKSDYGNYLAYVKNLPTQISTAGLGQAMALSKSKSRDSNPSVSKGHETLYAHVQDWLLNGWANSGYQGKTDLIEAFIAGTERDSIRAQNELMAYLEWLKKFAVTFLKSPD